MIAPLNFLTELPTVSERENWSFSIAKRQNQGKEQGKIQRTAERQEVPELGSYQKFHQSEHQLLLEPLLVGGLKRFSLFWSDFEIWPMFFKRLQSTNRVRCFISILVGILGPRAEDQRSATDVGQHREGSNVTLNVNFPINKSNKNIWLTQNNGSLFFFF